MPDSLCLRDKAPFWIRGSAFAIAALNLALGSLAVAGVDLTLDLPTNFTYVLTQWGGRDIGLAVIVLAALYLRSNKMLIVALVGAMFRDGSDVISGLQSADTGLAVISSAVWSLELASVIVLGRRERAKSGEERNHQD